MKVTVKVSPKKTVIDPQGAALQTAVHSLGLTNASHVRVGKIITFDLEGNDTPEIRKKMDQIARELFANPVIEDFEIEVK